MSYRSPSKCSVHSYHGQVCRRATSASDGSGPRFGLNACRSRPRAGHGRPPPPKGSSSTRWVWFPWQPLRNSSHSFDFVGCRKSILRPFVAGTEGHGWMKAFPRIEVLLYRCFMSCLMFLRSLFPILTRIHILIQTTRWFSILSTLTLT